MVNHVWGGGIQTVNTIYLVGPVGSHTSQLDLNTGYKVSDKTGYFLYIYFVTGKDDRAVFCIPRQYKHCRQVEGGTQQVTARCQTKFGKD